MDVDLAHVHLLIELGRKLGRLEQLGIDAGSHGGYLKRLKALCRTGSAQLQLGCAGLAAESGLRWCGKLMEDGGKVKCR